MSKPIRFSRRAGVAALSLALCLAVFAAWPGAGAADGLLDGPRAQGQVAERFDGYAVVRDPNAPASVHDLVADVNAKRAELYRQRAASEGVSAEAVGRVYAPEIFEAAPPGTHFIAEDGGVVRK